MAAINVTSGDNDTHTIKQGARAVVRLSNGRPYVIVENSSDDQIQVWKGNATTPASFSEPDVGNGPTGTVWGSCSVCVDSNDVIHISYCTDEGKTSQLRYVQFASDAFLNDTQVIADLEEDPTTITNLQTAIAIDSNNKPHIAVCHYAKTGGSTNYEISYINNVDNNWNAGVYYEVEGSGNAKDCKYPDISIDKDNKPVISYSNNTDYDVGTAIGNQNDAESFTLQDIDTDLEQIGSIVLTSICVDSSGNHYVVYRDDSDGFIYLRKHAYGVAWDTWVARATGSDQGYNPSLVADGTDIYIFYENASDDIAYEKVTGGSSWQGDVTLETGTYNNVKAKWAYAVDRDSGGTDRGGGSGRIEIDYVFTDTTATPDILFNSLVLGIAGLSINVFDGVGIGESLTPINPYDKFSVSDLIGIAENIVAGFGPTFYNISVNDKIAIIENIVSRISSLKTEPFDNVTIQEAITTKASTLKGSVQDLIGIQENISAKISDLEGSFYDRIAVQEAIDAIVSNPEINLFEKIGILEDITVALSSLADLEPSVQDLIGIVENIAIKMSGLKRLVKDTIGIEENVSAKMSALKSSVQDYITIQESISSVISNPEISVFDKIGVLENITIALSSLGDMEINVHDLVGIIENITTKMSGLKGTTQDQVAVIENISTDLGPTYSAFSIQDQISIQEIITSEMSDLEKSIYDQIGIQEDIVTNISGLKNLAQDQITIIENVIATIGPTYLDFSISDQIIIIENIIAKISDANCALFDTIGVQESIAAKASGLKSDLSEKIAVIESVLADLGPTYLGYSVNDYVAISEYINLSIPAVDILIDNIIDNIAVFEYVNVFITPVSIATGWKSWRNLGPWDFIAQGNKIEDPPYNDGYWYKGDV